MRGVFLVALVAWGAAGAAGCRPALAQSSPWDSVVANTNWYVTEPELLAFGAPATSFANPFPLGDQTLWTLGASSNGVFTGITRAQLAVGPLLSESVQSINGRVTPSGQILMAFEPLPEGNVTIGLGQMVERDGAYQMEMQMITGSGLLVTHWASMVSYDPATLTPPAPRVIPSNASPQWTWTKGTPWRITSPGLFGSSGAGSLVITDYKSGYFWGAAVAPGGARSGSYTVLGSITPEGRVLLNTLSGGQLTSLYGTVEGDPAAAAMLLGTYDNNVLFTGDITYLSLVQPYANTVVAENNPAAVGAATSLYGVAGTLDGLFGPLAPAIGVLNGLEGSALSTAISQTLPVLSGAGAQATYATQRAFQQVILNRIVSGHEMVAPGAEGSAWVRPFGGFASQGTVDGVTGYDAGGGGIAFGMDARVSPDALLGGVLAFSHTSISGADAQVPNDLDVDTYQLGLYGSYGLAPGLDLNVQLDAGYNQNSENRTISFMGTSTSADYGGWTGHGGIGLVKQFAMSPRFAISPSARVDYAQVESEAYTESGAGALDLTVESQTYRELMLTTGLKANYRIDDHLYLSATAAAGYNTLDNQTQIIASYAGGGASFATNGPDVSPWLYTFGASLAGIRTGALDISLSYEGQASPSSFLGQTGSLRFKMVF
jgi:outer membrane autotransporter protein